MNRSLVLLILGVIVLAMALLMFNQYSSTPSSNVSQNTAPPKAEPAGAQTSVPGQNTVASPPPAPAQESRPQAPSSTALMPTAPTTQAPGQAQGVPPWAAAMPSGASGSGGTSGHEGHRGIGGAAGTEIPAENTLSVSPAPSVVTNTQGMPSTASTPSRSPSAPSAASKTANKSKIIHKIVVSSADNGSMVRIVGVDGMQYKTMHLKNPERVVVDLDGVWAVKAPGVPANKYVSNVRIGKQRDQTRIVIDLRQTPENVRFVKQGTDTLEVRIK